MDIGRMADEIFSEDFEDGLMGNPEASTAPWRLLVVAAGVLGMTATISSVAWPGREEQAALTLQNVTILAEAKGKDWAAWCENGNCHGEKRIACWPWNAQEKVVGPPRSCASDSDCAANCIWD